MKKFRTVASRRPSLRALLVLCAAGPVAAQTADETGARSCITVSSIDRTKVVDDRTILFYMRNDVVYQNVLPRNCLRLKAEKRFGYDVEHNRLCAASQIVVYASGRDFRAANVCRIGLFSPVTEDEIDDLLANAKAASSKTKASRRAIESEPVELPPNARATGAAAQPPSDARGDAPPSAASDSP